MIWLQEIDDPARDKHAQPRLDGVYFHSHSFCECIVDKFLPRQGSEHFQKILELQLVTKLYDLGNIPFEVSVNIIRIELLALNPGFFLIVKFRIHSPDNQSKKLTDIRRDKIGLIFQQFHMVNYLTAVENVMVSQYYHSMPDEAEALEALGRVGLRERARHLPSQLSGGEQQRVCVARALINHPELILADEPTGNLDEANENIVLDLFRQLHREGTTLIVVTHDPEVAEAAQRTIVLEHGRVAREVVNENFGKN